MTGLWSYPNVPHKGWECVEVIDLEEVGETCEMCEVSRIRYVHVMEHEDYDWQVRAGCVCAEHMSGDYVNPKRREAKLKRQARERARYPAYRPQYSKAIGPRLTQTGPTQPIRDGEPQVAIIVKGSNTKFETAPAGTHVAICYGVFDMGTQVGFENKLTRKVRICWELSNELMSDGRPFTVSVYHTMSLNEKSNLRRDLVAWRGKQFSDDEIKSFDLASLLGKPAMLGVIHEPDGDKTWANVSSLSSLPKGMPVPTQVNESRQYSIDDPIPDWMPDWITNKIKDSVEKKAPSAVGVPAPRMAPTYAPDYVSAAAESPPF